MAAKRVLLRIRKSFIPQNFNRYFEWCEMAIPNEGTAKWIPADAMMEGL